MKPITLQKTSPLEGAVRYVLSELRSWVRSSGFDDSRLPRWLNAAVIRFGWLNNTAIMVLEDATQMDVFIDKGRIGADTVILLDVENFEARTVALPEAKGDMSILAMYEERKRNVLCVSGQAGAFLGCGLYGYHKPVIIFNMFFRLDEDTLKHNPIASRYVPLALYLDLSDLVSESALKEFCEKHIKPCLQMIHDGPIGSHYQQLHSRYEAYGLSKRSGVIVLGRDNGPELDSLIAVRDHLRGHGYDADLIKDLPEMSEASIEEKVRFWSLAARFAVVLDDKPAGHIAECVFLREQRTITALLRKRGMGSTRMIGDEGIVDVNFMKIFEYENTALDVLDEVVTWGENVAGERADAYDRTYPWRSTKSGGNSQPQRTNY